MSIGRHEDALGHPDLRLAGFQLWIHGHEFAEATDFWDGNWLRVTAHCGASGASVWVNGSILTAAELADWIRASKKLNESLSGEARLECMEPNLSVLLQAEGRAGHIRMVVHSTPDHLMQKHKFEFEIDQSHLPDFIRAGRKILDRFPVRGESPV
jgi:hypothetical protein